MKKVILLFAVSAVLFGFSSCKEEAKTKVKGTLTDSSFNGKKIYLYSLDLDSLSTTGRVAIDSADIVDGAFDLKGTVAKMPSVGMLGLAADKSGEKKTTPLDIFVVIEEGIVTAKFDGNHAEIGGTPLNESLNSVFYAVMNKTLLIKEEVDAAGGLEYVALDEKGMTVEQRVKGLSKELETGVYNYVKENIHNRVGETFFFTMGESFGKDKALALIEMADTTFQNRDEIKQVKEFYEYQKLKEAQVVGHPYKDISLPNLRGSKEALSRYVGKNKYVLIDFWASWCMPCLQEMPHLKEVYAKYRGKGFEIVGISLDRDEASWKEAIQYMDLSWKHLYDVKQEAAKVYDVASIPYTLLVDKNGTVVAMSLSAEELEAKLDELLK